MKDAFYFPHYSNARNDRKLKRVIKSLGVEGYGIYFMLLEVLRDQTEFRYPMADIDLLADEFGTSEAKVAAVIRNFDLFNIDDEQSFFSINLIKYLEPMFRMRDQRSVAGKASGEARRAKLLGDNKQVEDATFTETNDRSTTVQRMIHENEQSKEEESKVKESKGNKSIYTEDFENVWELYKRKGSKASAFNEWKKMAHEDMERAKIHIPAYVDSKKDNLKYMKDFERYLKDQTYHGIIITYRPDNIFKGGSW